MITDLHLGKSNVLSPFTDQIELNTVCFLRGLGGYHFAECKSYLALEGDVNHIPASAGASITLMQPCLGMKTSRPHRVENLYI